MRVAIAVGHTSKSRGAVGSFRTDEFTYAKEVAEHLGIDAFEFNPNKGYKSGCVELADELGDKYDLVLNLHFNACEDARANGVEALYYGGNDFGRELSQLYINTVADFYGTKKRTPNARRKASQRGYWAIALPKCTSLILEPFFCTNVEGEKFSSALEHAKVLSLFIQEAESLFCQKNKGL